MLYLEAFVLAVHFVLLLLLSLFGFHRLSMVLRWFWLRRKQPSSPPPFSPLPFVTVQVPLFNEKCVALRSLEAMAALDYPRDRLQIQMVDDSNDETSSLIAEGIKRYKDLGLDIQHFRRDHREDFKAGALKEALLQAKGEFITIFDADFLPDPTLLRKHIHHFQKKNVAVLQFRWEHLNRHRSHLTELQSVLLDAHLGLEQHMRYQGGCFFNFNGTAGVWRKSSIYDAGNWSSDTLTEDLDLSYRAQLRGWEMVYLNDVSCPAELPSDLNAFKSQQHRWVKGGTEVMFKLMPKIWAAPIGIKRKIEASFHMSNNMAYLLLLLDVLLFFLPSVLIRERFQMGFMIWLDLPLLLASSFGHIIFLIFGQYVLGRSVWKTIKNAPSLWLLGIQISFNNARAAGEAILGKKSEFVRTPKSGENDSNLRKSLGKRYLTYPKGLLWELLVSCLFIAWLCMAIAHQLWGLAPFLLFFIVGNLSTSLISWSSYQNLKAS